MYGFHCAGKHGSESSSAASPTTYQKHGHHTPPHMYCKPVLERGGDVLLKIVSRLLPNHINILNSQKHHKDIISRIIRQPEHDHKLHTIITKS